MRKEIEKELKRLRQEFLELEDGDTYDMYLLGKIHALEDALLIIGGDRR